MFESCWAHHKHWLTQPPVSLPLRFVNDREQFVSNLRRLRAWSRQAPGCTRPTSCPRWRVPSTARRPAAYAWLCDHHEVGAAERQPCGVRQIQRLTRREDRPFRTLLGERGFSTRPRAARILDFAERQGRRATAAAMAPRRNCRRSTFRPLVDIRPPIGGLDSERSVESGAFSVGGPDEHAETALQNRFSNSDDLPESM